MNLHARFCFSFLIVTLLQRNRKSGTERFNFFFFFEISIGKLMPINKSRSGLYEYLIKVVNKLIGFVSIFKEQLD